MTKTALKVSVIIVNWNGERFLERCLAALMDQTAKPYEIILVDNASSDGSIEVVRQFPSERLMVQDQNTGFARANNLAIEAASQESEWIALINPDAFLEPDWLNKMLSAAMAYPEYSFFASRLAQAANHEILDGEGDTMHACGLAWREGHGQAISKGAIKPREIFSPCAAAALYRRDAFEAVGGFDEDFFCYFEDVDLGFRLRLAGHRCLLVPDAVAYHVGSATTGKRSDFSIYHGHRNLVWTYVKNMPGALFWLLLPLHIALNLVTIVWFSLQGQGVIILKAKWDALCGIPRMWKKRRDIQRNRSASVGEIWQMLDKSFLPHLSKFRRRWL